MRRALEEPSFCLYRSSKPPPQRKEYPRGAFAYVVDTKDSEGKLVMKTKVMKEAFNDRFIAILKELAALRYLRHPNIIKAHRMIMYTTKDFSKETPHYDDLQRMKIGISFVKGNFTLADWIANSQKDCREAQLRIEQEDKDHQGSAISVNQSLKQVTDLIPCLMYQLLSGIFHMHSRGIVHRDLKPQNIILFLDTPEGSKILQEVSKEAKNEKTDIRQEAVSENKEVEKCQEGKGDKNGRDSRDNMDCKEGFPKASSLPLLQIADFGANQFGILESRGEKHLSVITSLDYRAPEMLIGDLRNEDFTPYGSKTDLWSAGAIFFYLLAYEPLFDINNEKELFTSINRLYEYDKPKVPKSLRKPPENLHVVVEGLPSQKRKDPPGCAEFAHFPATTKQCSEKSTVPTLKRSKIFSEFLSKESGKFSESTWVKLVDEDGHKFPWVTDKALDLLRKLLTINPQKRISALEALQHPYFKDIHVSEAIKKFNIPPAEMKETFDQESFPRDQEDISREDFLFLTQNLATEGDKEIPLILSLYSRLYPFFGKEKASFASLNLAKLLLGPSNAKSRPCPEINERMIKKFGPSSERLFNRVYELLFCVSLQLGFNFYHLFPQIIIEKDLITSPKNIDILVALSYLLPLSKKENSYTLALFIKWLSDQLNKEEMSKSFLSESKDSLISSISTEYLERRSNFLQAYQEIITDIVTKCDADININSDLVGLLDKLKNMKAY